MDAFDIDQELQYEQEFHEAEQAAKEAEFEFQAQIASQEESNDDKPIQGADTGDDNLEESQGLVGENDQRIPNNDIAMNDVEPDSSDDEEAVRLAEEAKLPFYERRKRRLAARAFLEAQSGGLKSKKQKDISDYLYKRPGIIIGGDQGVVLSNGEMRYLNIDTSKDPYHSNYQKAQEDMQSCRADFDQEGGSLLERPISELMAILEEEERIVELAKAKARYEARQVERDGDDGASGDELLDETSGATQTSQDLGSSQKFFTQTPLKARKSKSGRKSAGRGLLVDRYAPKAYIEVVSNERQSRNTLNWVLAWDKFVFDKKVPASNIHIQALGASASNKKDRTRPWKKLILLSGPPGAGKTSLARIIARKCGYNPVEINASDERTGSLLQARLVAAMETQSMFGNNKPNCIILDEFEGVANTGEDSGFVSILAKMAEAHVRGSFGAEGDDSAKDKDLDGATSRKKTIPPITRPIILICNNAFAPVLRPLRQHCVQVRFFNSSKERVVSRLSYVCSQEGIQPEPGALEALCDLSENDIRGCLHALQFAMNERSPTPVAGSDSIDNSPVSQSRTTISQSPFGKVEKPLGSNVQAKMRLSAEMVRSVCSSQRDSSSDLFKAWGEVFQLKQLFGNRGINHSAQKSKAEKAYDEQARALDVFHKHLSEFTMVADGIHENMCSVGLADRSLDNMLAVLEALIEADHAGQRLLSEGGWSFASYLPMCALKLRRLCRADNARARLSFPIAGKLFRDRKTEMLSIISDFQEKSGRVSGVTAKSFAAEFASPLLQILSPRVRSVPWNLLNHREQASIQNVVECMRSLGMSLKRSEDWQPANNGDKEDSAEWSGPQRTVFRLEPRIDKLVTFGRQTPYNRSHRPLVEPSWQSSNIISHRIQLLNMRIGGSRHQDEETSVVKKAVRMIGKHSKGAESVVSSKSRARDFFGREVVAKEEEIATPTAVKGSKEADKENHGTDDTPGKKRRLAELDRKKNQIIYVFKEGLTDAVRRPCYMQDFFSI